MNLYGGVIAGGSTPALVHVSTAYVAGVQKGVIPEGPLDHRVDYRLELELAMEARHDVEAAVPQAGDAERLPGRGAQGARARRARRPWPSDAEERRQKWVTKRLVEYGRTRARSLGWPDVYTFTKAMGERAVEELAAEANLPLSASCGPRSSSRPTRTRSPGGSTGSRWPTRSSAPTGWGRSRSSPASPRASSTSSPSTSW